MLDSYWVKKWASDAYRQEAEDLARLDPYWVKKYARDRFGEEELRRKRSPFSDPNWRSDPNLHKRRGCKCTGWRESNVDGDYRQVRDCDCNGAEAEQELRYWMFKPKEPEPEPAHEILQTQVKREEDLWLFKRKPKAPETPVKVFQPYPGW